MELVQDDALFPHLTTRETLMFSARLRLPGSMSNQEKARRVDSLIQQLGLVECANTYVGVRRFCPLPLRPLFSSSAICHSSSMICWQTSCAPMTSETLQENLEERVSRLQTFKFPFALFFFDSSEGSVRWRETPRFNWRRLDP